MLRSFGSFVTRAHLTTLSCIFLVSAQPLGAAPTSSAQLRFDPCQDLICLDVELMDGRSHRVLLDTGNVNSWLSEALARKMGLQLESISQESKTIEGIYRLGVQTVRIGNYKLSGKFLAFGPQQAGDLPQGVEGALSYTLFKEHVVQIDYRRSRLTVSESPRTAEPRSPLELITFGHKGPPVLVASGFRVNGKPIRVQIDTCYTGTLLIYDDAIDSLGLRTATARGQPRFFPYTDGGVSMKESTVDSLVFGEGAAQWHPAVVYFSAPGKTPVHQPDGLFEGTIGNRLMSDSTITLDFKSMTFNIRRSRKATASGSGAGTSSSGPSALRADLRALRNS